MGVVSLAMTIGGLIVAAILLAVSYFAKIGWLRTFVSGGVFVWILGSVILLLIGSIFSQEQTLKFNDPKEFCGFYLDCHMHAAVTGVRKEKQVGDLLAQNEFYIVNLKIFSDAKRATLRLIETKAEAHDEGGRVYSRRDEVEKLLPTASVSHNQDVSNGASFEKEIVFDITEPAKNVRLLVTEGYGIDKVIESIVIGDEDSVFHKPVYFSLENSEQIAQ